MSLTMNTSRSTARSSSRIGSATRRSSCLPIDSSDTVRIWFWTARTMTSVVVAPSFGISRTAGPPTSAVNGLPAMRRIASLQRMTVPSALRMATPSAIASNVRRQSSLAIFRSCSTCCVRSSERTVATSSGGSIGCARYASAPLSSPSTRRSAEMNVADVCRIGILRSSGSAFSRRQTSRPLMSGSFTSRTTICGRRRASISASRPFAASATTKPACSRIRVTMYRFASSSLTLRMNGRGSDTRRAVLLDDEAGFREDLADAAERHFAVQILLRQNRGRLDGEPLTLVVGEVARRVDDHRDGARGGIELQLVEDFERVHAGKDEVEEDHLRLALARETDAVGARRRLDHLVVRLRQHLRHHVARHLVVVDDEDGVDRAAPPRERRQLAREPLLIERLDHELVGAERARLLLAVGDGDDHDRNVTRLR